MYNVTDPVTTETEVRDIITGQFASQTGKILDHIDELCRVWIEHSPFLTMATYAADGRVDVSPKGDPAGFVRVLDRHTLAVPDRPGNHRYDSFRNILETGRIGLVFMVPQRNEVVRVNGSAEIARDLPLRESLAVQNRIPDFALVVRVEEAFYHCGKSMIRSGLWRPETWGDVAALPTYGAALKAHGALEDSLEDLEKRMRYNEEKRLYDE